MLTTIFFYIACLFLGAVVFLGVVKYFKIGLIKMLYITTFSVFFPLTIPFAGKDALTTGGIMILILYVLYLFSTLKLGGEVIKGYDWLIYLLIVYGALANKIAYDDGYIMSEDLGPVIRQYSSFVTSLLLFIVIKNAIMNAERYGTTASAVCEKLLSLIMILTASHVLISVLCRYFPAANSLFTVFYDKDSDALLPDGQSRITSFVFSYENYGEMLAALCPLAIYKMAATKNSRWFACVAIFTGGVLLSVTRSGIMLFVFALALSILYQFRKEPGRAAGFSALLIGAALVVVAVDPKLLGDLFERFTVAEDAYSTGASVFDTINRGNFPDIWDEVLSTLTLFGHSMLRIDYHNLFLTTMHQLGVLGVLLFFAAFCTPLFLLLKSFFGDEGGAPRALVFSCLMFMILFLINEMKVEFTRSASYTQLCWEMFALCYLVARQAPQEQVT